MLGCLGLKNFVVNKFINLKLHVFNFHVHSTGDSAFRFVDQVCAQLSEVFVLLDYSFFKHTQSFSQSVFDLGFETFHV